MSKQFSTAQLKALSKLSSTEWKSAYTLGVRLDTLRSLAKLGLVDYKREFGADFFPHSNIMFRLSQQK